MMEKRGIRKRRRRSHLFGRKTILAMLSLIVVCVTVGALIHPGETLNYTCGQKEHVHSEACYEIVTAETEDVEAQEDVETEEVIVCGIAEHTHTDDCRSSSALEDDTKDENAAETVVEGESISHEGKNYTTEVIYTDDTNLTSSTLVSSVEIDSDSEEYEENIKEIEAGIDWGDVSEAVLFDVNLTKKSKIVQPDAPVTVRFALEHPVFLSANETICGVHFGEEGVEVLPASLETDDTGAVVAVVYEQESFSTSGFVFVHTENETDIGPDSFPVHYAMLINGKWYVVGSTRTGWNGNYTGKENWTNDTRDFITTEQLLSVYGKYGLTEERINQDCFYQRAEWEGMTIRFDTYVQNDKQLTTKDGGTVTKDIFPLSGNEKKDSGYHIFYIPDNPITKVGYQGAGETTFANSAALLKEFTNPDGTIHQFYTFTVRDMNNIVYSIEEENNPTIFPQQQIIKHGNPISVTVRANGEYGWQWVNDAGNVVRGKNNTEDPRFHYKDNGDGTETYSFDGILGRTTLIPYSEAVEDAEKDTGHVVDIAVHLDGEWQVVGSLNLMYKKDGVCVDPDNKEQTYWFVTAGQIFSILKDYGFEPTIYDDMASNEVRNYTFSCQDGRMNINNNMVCKGPIQEIQDSWAIGLGAGNHDYTLYYLPGSTTATDYGTMTPAAYAESKRIIGDRFFTINVVDDNQLVYYAEELEYMKPIALEGTTVSVSVESAAEAQWSLRSESGKYRDLKPKYEGSLTTFTFENVTETIDLVATSINPHFTVEYYADLNRYALSSTGGTNKLELIDTSGKNLPTNQSSLPLKYIELQGTGKQTDQNAGNHTALYRVKTNENFEKIYQDAEFEYAKANHWNNIDKLYNNDGYLITEIRVLKEGMPPDSKNPDDWWRYATQNNGANITFTNNAWEQHDPKVEGQVQPADQNYEILITEGMVIQLYYKTYSPETKPTFDTTFYDYDISDGNKNTGTNGINTPENYNPNYNPNDDDGVSLANIYGFGNSNCSSGIGGALWEENLLNQYNISSKGGKDSFKGCTYGLVKGFNPASGELIWNGVNAPKVFGSTDTKVTGRTVYKDGTLTFNRQGDVYTLSAANSTAGSRNNLEEFFNPSPNTSTTHSHIYTNNFWVVDKADNADPIVGSSTSINNTIISGRSNPLNQVGGAVSNKKFPIADDGSDHNYFFGMNFSVAFDLTSDYIGPMEYIFFGDDDMWVFLSEVGPNNEIKNTQLICDIGGVHSSVGEYVNIRDYLPVGSKGNYLLNFYYTERGASGSTCWMSFTLPSVASVNLEEDTAGITVSKEVEAPNGDPVDDDYQDFEFTFRLYEDEKKQRAINKTFIGQVIDDDGKVVSSPTVYNGSTFTLQANQKMVISYVPIGSYYVITESQTPWYKAQVNAKEDYVYQGKVEEVNIGAFVNTQVGYKLPDTGGDGIKWYVFSGAIMMFLAAFVHIERKGKIKKRRVKY